MNIQTMTSKSLFYANALGRLNFDVIYKSNVNRKQMFTEKQFKISIKLFS